MRADDGIGKPEHEFPVSSGHDFDVIVLANYATDKQESMLRFAKTIEAGLEERKLNVRVLRPRSVFGRIRRSATGIGKWLGYVDKFLLFPIEIRRAISSYSRVKRLGGRKVCVHVCDHSNAIYTKYLGDVPHVVTCHDLLAVRSARGEVVQNQTRLSGRVLQNFILNGLRRAQLIACISEATRRDVLKIVGFGAGRIEVVYMGLNFPYTPVAEVVFIRVVAKILARVFGPVGMGKRIRYILHVGGGQWYKNRMGVLGIYLALRARMSAEGESDRVRLVFVGPEPDAAMRERISCNPGLQPDIAFLSDLSNEELMALYSGAELLLFPSLEEGFGWPVVEAQACGCRVVTSGKAPMTEIGGDAAVYLDPERMLADSRDAHDSAAEMLFDVLHESEERRRRRVADGLGNSRRFPTEKMIEEYLALYSRAVANACASQQRL